MEHRPKNTNSFYNMRHVPLIIYFLEQSGTNIYLLEHKRIPRPDYFNLRRCAGLRLSRCPFPLFSRPTQGGIGLDRPGQELYISNGSVKSEKMSRSFSMTAQAAPLNICDFSAEKKEPVRDRPPDNRAPVKTIFTYLPLQT